MGAGRLLLPCLIACLSLNACGPHPPLYRDALEGLTTSSRGGDVPADVLVRAGRKVAFAMGPNVERFTKYQDDGNAFAASLGFSKEFLDGNSPKDLVAGTVDIIKRRYPGAVHVEGLAAARRDGVTTTLVVDIQTKPGLYSGDHSTVDLVIIAFDAAQNPVSRITARGSIQIKPYVPPNIRQAYDQALGELSRKADRLLN